MNNCVLIGRLVAEPDLQFIPSSGKAVAKFTLAVDKELPKDIKADYESKGKPTADFIRITVFGKQAEASANYLKKGIMTSVIGRISTGSYTTKDGDKRFTTEVIANKVEFLEWADKKESSGPKEPEDEWEGYEADLDSEDIPF